MHGCDGYPEGQEALPRHRVIVLGAGRAVRGGAPSAIHPVNAESCILDWLLSAFEVLEDARVHFVAGFRAEAVMQRYPDIHFTLNSNWESTGPARSLACAPLSSKVGTYVSYADVVYRPNLVRRMESCPGDVVLAADRAWQRRYEGRSATEMQLAEKLTCRDGVVTDIGTHLEGASATDEFVGVARFSQTAIERLAEAFGRDGFDRKAGLPEVIRYLLDGGLAVRAIDVAGEWAELNTPQDLSRFVLGTKAESLERLKPLVRLGQIDDLLTLTHAQWTKEPGEVLTRIQETFSGNRVIVRSSAVIEDSWEQSHAGAFQSILDVSVDDERQLRRAVNDVIASYGEALPDNQVLVQRMLSDVTMSGVILTRTLSLGAPYYVINYDDISNRTDTVTSGNGRGVRSLVLHRDAALPSDRPAELNKLIEVVRELERLVGHDSLDVEFAFTADRCAHVLQVRPIAVKRPDYPVDDQCLADGLSRTRRFWEELRKPPPWILGESTELNVMSDWNPAEIIGTKPSRLALSLYRTLITDETWATQRAEYGYRDVRPCNLIVDVLGHPYIDVRATFNSFVPADVPDELADKLINHYLAKLSAHPELHDKVEFDVLLTCLTFDFDRRADELCDAGFTEEEVAILRKSLRELTVVGIRRCERDLSALDTSEERFKAICKGNYPPLERAYMLLEDARLHSILRFAHLARAGFVAVSLLRSLATMGVTSNAQTEAFLSSVRTVSSDIQRDAKLVALGSLGWDTFIERYGHLRPGTYDLTSPHYAGAPEEYLRPIVASAGKIRFTGERPPDPWDSHTRRSIAEALGSLDDRLTLDEFELFCRRAIEGREFGKLVFTKNLSAALEALAEFGAEHGLNREQMSHISIEDLLAFRSVRADDIGRRLERMAADGREAWYVTQAACLPDRITSEQDLICFEQSRVVPNFVTQRRVQGLVSWLSPRTVGGDELAGRIALVPSADPGFDWIFSRDIAGLITQYGGANSHMAIRAAEFQLPAAIGVGEAMYEQLGGVDMVELDCAGRCIRTIR